MFVWGCEEPGLVNTGVWNCDLNPESSPTGVPFGPACSPGKQQILYLWEKGDGDFSLPNVQFKVGPGTGLNHLVLRVFYAPVENTTAVSGRPEVVVKTAVNGCEKPDGGSLVLLAYGDVPPHGVIDSQVTLPIRQNVSLHLIAFHGYTNFPGGEVTLSYSRKYGPKEFIGSVDKNMEMKTPFYDATLVEGDIVIMDCVIDNRSDQPIVSM